MLAQLEREERIDVYNVGMLLARPDRVTNAGPTGLQPLEIGQGRDGFIYTPASYRPDKPAPLALMLHGAGGGGQGNLWPLLDLADEAGVIVVGPDSRQTTWDMLLADYGPDVEFIDRALAQTFRRYAVDPSRLAIAGFSDGASYGLSLGLINGELFSHVIAFSPGFIAPTLLAGKPRVFVSHGVHDDVLPIDMCSRHIIPQLKRARYDLRYEEFDGPHTVPPAIAREAMNWLLT